VAGPAQALSVLELVEGHHWDLYHPPLTRKNYGLKVVRGFRPGLKGSWSGNSGVRRLDDMLKGLKKAHCSGEHVDVEVTLSSHSGLATVGGVRAARELAHPASGENAGPLSPMNALFLCAVAAMGATGNGFVLQPSVHARARLAPGVCHRSGA